MEGFLVVTKLRLSKWIRWKAGPQIVSNETIIDKVKVIELPFQIEEKRARLIILMQTWTEFLAMKTMNKMIGADQVCQMARDIGPITYQVTSMYSNLQIGLKNIQTNQM